MKFQFFSILLSTFSLADAAEVVTMALPQCINFESIKMVGDAKFVGNPSAPKIGKKCKIWTLHPSLPLLTIFPICTSR